jgi:hypothetical protein
MIAREAKTAIGLKVLYDPARPVGAYERLSNAFSHTATSPFANRY